MWKIEVETKDLKEILGNALGRTPTSKEMLKFGIQLKYNFQQWVRDNAKLFSVKHNERM